MSFSLSSPQSPLLPSSIKAGASAPGISVERIALIRRAVEAHDTSSVDSILKLHDDIDANESIPGLSMPLLHLAVGFSDNTPDIVLLLLKKGGDPNNTYTEEQLSPMHLSVIYDFDDVLKVLMQFGGDPIVPGGDKKNCYDLAKDNVEDSMQEKCFLHFYRKSLYFRKSIKPSDSVALAWRSHHSQSLLSMDNDNSQLSQISSSDGFVTCESDFEHVVPPRPTSPDDGNIRIEVAVTPKCVQVEEISKEDGAGAFKFDASNGSINSSGSEADFQQIKNKFSYLMTPDDEDCSDDEHKRLSTIEEESALSASLQRRLGYDSLEDRTGSSLSMSSTGDRTDTPDTDPSCANSTPPILPAPSRQELTNLQKAMKTIGVPVTQSTYRVINKYAGKQEELTEVLAPKPGSHNYSSELKLSIQNLQLIDDWGNLKVDLLQSFTPTGKISKSFYNYLLLDPKVIKRVNFSGTHLKSDIIKNPQKFATFLKSIFYIGKGCGKRPIQHLVDAKAKYVPGNKKPLSNEEKLDKILEIWKSGLGVIVVSVFHYSSEREANVNEASMIDAVGLSVLSNIKKGSYGGLAQTWTQKTKNQFGSFLLYKAFCAFTVSEHKSFYPQDI